MHAIFVILVVDAKKLIRSCSHSYGHL